MLRSAFSARPRDLIPDIPVVISRSALLATMLTAALGCDKASSRAGAEASAQRGGGTTLDLSAQPTILFQLFGGGEDVRMIPVAAIRDRRIVRIVLSDAGWRRFDARYLRKGAQYTIYRDGRASGTVRVKRGMWEPGTSPLYDLPNCTLPTPIAAVTVDPLPLTATVELLASNGDLASAHPTRSMTKEEIRLSGRTVAYRAGKAADLGRSTLDSLDFEAIAVPTGVAAVPTLVAAFSDPAIGRTPVTVSTTAHLFVIADIDSGGEYRPTYLQRMNGPVEIAEFRSYYDHLALTGGPTDNIVLEGWHFGGDTFLSILGFDGGRWIEQFRSRTGWCIEEK
ncbi:MAG: hypothetical protein M3068_05040 [Gemmatimonadota bacterium]|nr:hypothetical protein [Gemmatimonadota bacterium]